MNDRVGPWVRRFLVEYLIGERNYSLHTQQSRRDTFVLFLPFAAKLASDGYHVVQSIAVPVTAASLRLAVRDTRANRVGSLEVQLPLAKTAEAKTPELKTPEK